jgi:hypothetical protein
MGAMAASVSLVSGETGEGVDGLWSRIAHILEQQKDDVVAGPG